MRVDPYQIMLFGLACRSANVTINCWAIEKISGVTLVAEKDETSLYSYKLSTFWQTLIADNPPDQRFINWWKHWN